MVRYLDLLYTVRRRTKLYSFAFYSLRVSISLGSLVVPALLSLSQSEFLFWIIWTLSLFVSISNSLIGIFRIDKKYYTLNALYKKIESEGWQFINLTGNYYTLPEFGHDSQIQNFSFRLETIYMTHADEEYRKNIDQMSQNSVSQDATYVPKQKSLAQVNAGFPATKANTSSSQQNTKASEKPQATTVIAVAQERPVDEST
jgi:hypothetical protein